MIIVCIFLSEIRDKDLSVALRPLRLAYCIVEIVCVGVCIICGGNIILIFFFLVHFFIISFLFWLQKIDWESISNAYDIARKTWKKNHYLAKLNLKVKSNTFQYFYKVCFSRLLKTLVCFVKCFKINWNSKNQNSFLEL